MSPLVLAHPERLWLLATLPPLAVALACARARRARDWRALGQSGGPSPGRDRLWGACLTLLVVALAGPRWGRSEAPPLPPGHDVVLAVDVSRSMGALDAVPDRLAVAVEAAEGLAGAAGGAAGDRVAVVAFAGRGVLRCPLTTDLDAVVRVLRALRPGGVRPGGSDLAAGLDAALDAFDDLDHAGGRSVVLVSDGEDHADRWRAAAERLRDRGVVVHAVAVGDDRHGARVPVRRGDLSEAVRHEGREVVSRRSDEALAAVARETGGAFVPLGLTSADLGRLYRARIEPVARARREAVRAPEPIDRAGVFLVAALSLGLVACLPTRPGLSPSRAWRGALVLALAATLPGAGSADTPSAAVAEGRAAYAAGRFEAALNAFRRAERLAPRSPIPRYNAGAALFQLGRYGEASAAYRAARERTRAGNVLRAKIDFALGNSALARGDIPAALARYDDCLASPARGDEADRVRGDAATNRRFVVEHAPQAPGAGQEGGSPGDRPRGKSGTDGPGATRPGPAGGGTGPPDPGAAGPSTRGPGGAGGAGSTTPPPAGSPAERLARALDNVREARARRIEDRSDSTRAPAGLKDW